MLVMGFISAVISVVVCLCCLIVVCLCVVVVGLFVGLMIAALALIRYLSCLCLVYCVGGCFVHGGFRRFVTDDW